MFFTDNPHQQLVLWMQASCRADTGDRHQRLVVAAAAVVYGTAIPLTTVLRLRYQDLEIVEGGSLGPHLLADHGRGPKELLRMETCAVDLINKLSAAPLNVRTGLIFGKTGTKQYTQSSWHHWLLAMQDALDWQVELSWIDILDLGRARIEAALSELELPLPLEAIDAHP